MTIHRVSTAEAVVNYFKEEIEGGRLRAGDQLPSERILQHDLGISRFSLREGLARLSALGIIRIVHGKGAFLQSEVSSRSLGDVLVPLVSGGNGEHLEDLFEARRLIEGEASRLAARRRTGEGLAQLRRILELSEQECDDPTRFGEHDFLFHRQIAALSGNVFIEKMLEVLNESVRSFLLAHARSEESRKRALTTHRKILECIEAGDHEGASKFTVEHLSGCKSNYETSIGKKGPSHGKPA